jgi:hypothetical protein
VEPCEGTSHDGGGVQGTYVRKDDPGFMSYQAEDKDKRDSHNSNVSAGCVCVLMCSSLGFAMGVCNGQRSIAAYHGHTLMCPRLKRVLGPPPR